MADVFKNDFFTIAGQKERLTNVGNVLSIAITGKDLSGNQNTIVANTPSSIANYALETAANHPFLTAGVAATAVTAAPYVATAARQVTTTIGATATKAASTVSGISSGVSSSFGGYGGTVAAGAVGVGIGALLGGKSSGGDGGAAQNRQDITPIQQPVQQTSGTLGFTPATKNDYWQDNSITTWGDNSPVETTGNTPTMNNPFTQSPSQDFYPTQGLGQDTYADADALGGTGGEAGTNWLPLIALGIGAYYLMSKN